MSLRGARFKLRIEKRGRSQSPWSGNRPAAQRH
jgi:hypothetical protein